MITERDAEDVLPPAGFVRAFYHHGYRQTTAPAIYHLGVALTVLSATCPADYGMHFAGELRPNLFTLLIGRSGEDQKSTAVNIGRDLLFHACAERVGDFPGSAEGLLDSLSRVPTQMIPISEFGKLLASAQRGYFEPIKTLLTDLWDAQATQRAKANNKIVRIDNPRLSVTGGCSIPYLEKHTLAEDWTGGFMGRWLVLYGYRERLDPDPVGDPTLRKPLIDWLARRIDMKAGWCLGLDDEARVLWTDWFTDVMNRNLPSTIVGIRARAPTIARKIALLYGWDYGPASEGKQWLMSTRELDPAIRFVELHIKSLVSLSKVLAEHADARVRRTVIDTLRDSGGFATLGEILLRTKMRKRPIAETLDALCEEGTVAREQTAEGTIFRLTSYI